MKWIAVAACVLAGAWRAHDGGAADGFVILGVLISVFG